METVTFVVGAATTLSSLCGQVKAYKKQSERLAERVDGLKGLVLTIRVPDQISAKVKKALRRLKATLENAEAVVEEYTNDGFLKRLMKTFTHDDEFESLNISLNRVFQELSLALQLDNKHQVCQLFELSSQLKEDKEDKEEDKAELQQILQEMKKKQDSMLENQDVMMGKLDAIEQNTKMKGNGTPGKDAVDSSTGNTDADKAHFVMENRSQVIQNAAHVMAIVDSLQDKNMIHPEFYAAIEAEKTDIIQMRKLYQKVIQPGGSEVRAAFYDAIKEHLPNLLKKLGDSK